MKLSDRSLKDATISISFVTLYEFKYIVQFDNVIGQIATKIQGLRPKELQNFGGIFFISSLHISKFVMDDESR